MKVPSELIVYLLVALCSAESEESSHTTYKIEGKVSVPHAPDSSWISNTRVLVEGGQYLGLIKSDGTFVVTNVPSGSYVVEVVNPKYVFEPARVDITSKGKIRARKVDNIQHSKVTVSYPLKLKARSTANYFQKREQWRITDFIFNPMVLMMVLPLLLLMVLPKLINTQDPDTQKELQQSMNLMSPRQNMPDASELLTKVCSIFEGPQPVEKKSTKAKTSKKRQ